ncbi:MAG: putative AlkP superfamily phosphohydrolase/phosphomutase/Tfp pilus assembly protein PilF [Congregibacter sp.]|jgi:predicted AlkP superfamily phosphohydrolase/phosphomutase/Tfp pilus assembly protein PilF
MSQKIANKVLLLGWDAADWKIINPLIDAGKMPYLERLINQGAMGDLETQKPILSPMLWSSIATGKRADKHGIFGFTEPKPDGSGIRPITSTSLKCQPIWNMLEHSGLKSAVVGWFATHPAHAVSGTVVSNHFAQPSGANFEQWPLTPNTISPKSLEATLADLRVHPDDIGLSELIEFIPQAAELPKDDKKLISLVKLLARCMTLHGAGTYLAQHAEWDLLAVYHDTLDLICHDFIEQRPPKMDHVSEKEVEIYGGVVDAMYCFHDLMLGRYMKLVGPETTIMIVSDHGFLSDHRRPNVSAHTQEGSPVEWHRDHGVLAVRGPGIKADSLVFGANQLDITPTLLQLLGLPVGRDMAGKPLSQILAQPQAAQWIDSWDDLIKTSTTVEDYEEDPWAAQEMVKQLVALGYIDKPDPDATKAIEQVTQQKYASLTEVYLSTNRFKQAQEYIELQLAHNPANKLARLRLARCRLKLDDIEGCKAIADQIVAGNPDTPMAHMLYGQIYSAQGLDDLALECFLKAEQAGYELPKVRYRLANIYLRRQLWLQAEAIAEGLLEHDDHNARYYHVQGMALLGQKRYQEATIPLMQAVSLRYDLASAHVDLALALIGQQQHNTAINSLHNALKSRPNTTRAHTILARLYKDKGDISRSSYHYSKSQVKREKLVSTNNAMTPHGR